ncbi:efflux RND transporter periplasmic adaptor subunit [Propionivibrio dicarboxylicus]|uniref:Membrane fusion protein, cobalt-zinc-cadmium efflux system n=1 Tax=Propionivibrio dicarboxylicus TaxID=83767 RepID=A0A1G8E242_9RHOO|nr:efflux RND transporter periplasmic adaptor subunit [Propionivibrio dicarboxylicus]SDH63973.1 membrane fusion protein, cobalt-zinc-cadmium efflux system [Propionivibrio dicarboxylicus]
MKTTRFAPTVHALAYVFIALTFALILAGCGKQKPGETGNTPPPDPNVVTAPETLNGVLKVAEVGTAPISDTLRVAGRVDFDEQHVARIGAPITGRVVELLAETGQAVTQGQPLARLHSVELGNAQLAYVKSSAQAKLQAQSAARARLLFDSDVIGAAELQRRESEYAIARAEQQAAADQLRVLGVGARELDTIAASGGINSVAPVIATLSGVVVERKVVKGLVVQPADALFTVADLSRVWVIAQVPEAESGAVHTGQTVEVEVPALGNVKRRAKLIFVSDIVHPETRTITVRTEMDNPDRELKPAMLATMLIQSRPQERLVVPTQAIVREENVDYVFVDEGERRYRLTRVRLRGDHQGVQIVEQGLRPGDRVVVEGAFHLNNERKRAELEGS